VTSTTGLLFTSVISFWNPLLFPSRTSWWSSEGHRQLQAGVPTMDLRQWSAGAFVQDTWRVTPHTTIDAGVRYEFMSAFTDTSRWGRPSFFVACRV
jgi:outer membrane receptor protein involved in Fe transport